MLPVKKEKAPENQGLDLIHLPGDARGRRTGNLPLDDQQGI